MTALEGVAQRRDVLGDPLGAEDEERRRQPVRQIDEVDTIETQVAVVRREVRTKGGRGMTPVWTDPGRPSILPAARDAVRRSGLTDTIAHTGSDLCTTAFSGGKVHDF